MPLSVLGLEFGDLVIAFILIGFAGFVDSIAGGGGLITVPTFMFLGLPPQSLLGTNKLVSTAGASLAIWRYSKARAIDWRRFKWAILTSFGSAILGASLSRYQSNEFMVSLLLAITPLIFLMSTKKIHSQIKKIVPESKSFFAIIFVSFLLGGYDGFFGPGTGSFFLFFLLFLFNLKEREASANARILNYASNLGALLFFISAWQISWPLAAFGVSASLLGNTIGSHLVIHQASRWVRPLFYLVLFGLLVKLSIEMF
jgi:uncharacterized membrane protein YfcA